MDTLITDIQLEVLLGIIYDKYGYDFYGYSKKSLKRRILRILKNSNLKNYNQMHEKLRANSNFFRYFIDEITVNVTSMFRDAHFFNYLRRDLLPQFASCSHVRIWHAGCSSGEEVYSCAILLDELGLLERSIIYATDINDAQLNTARRGVYSKEMLADFQTAYERSGGSLSFENYYTTQSDNIQFKDYLKKRIVFSTHNLATDQSFNEFNLLICRNVLIYFDEALQNKVLSLFAESLQNRGYLALGSKENIRNFSNKAILNPISNKANIWQKSL